MILKNYKSNRTEKIRFLTPIPVRLFVVNSYSITVPGGIKIMSAYVGFMSSVNKG